MSIRHIPLFDLKLSRQTVRQVRQTLESGWLTTGSKTGEFEKRIAAMLGVRYAAALSSGTAGLYLVLQSIGAAGREVITTPFTFIATVETIFQTGAVPIFADIDPETLTIDPDEVLRKITEKTACILAVDIAGHPVDYDRLQKVASEFSIPLISDASHAFGATYRGKSIPKFSDAAVYSFHATKNLTCGEGGAVVSKFKPLVEKIRLLSRHAMTAGAYQRRRKGIWKYDVVDLGYKGNLSDVHASIGLGELERFGKNQMKREQIARRYVKNLMRLSDFLWLPVTWRHVAHAWHLFIIRLQVSRLSIDRNQFIALMAERGIECGVHYRPIYDLKFYKQMGLSGRIFPNVTYAARRVVSLPIYPELRMGDVDYICEAVADVVKSHRR
jgi:dTDP-4-amino-4,6-dideoxygalactose transaminase